MHAEQVFRISEIFMKFSVKQTNPLKLHSGMLSRAVITQNS